MFKSKDVKPQIVGAKEKIRQAQALAEAQRQGNQKKTGRKEKQTPIGVVILMIAGMAMGLAALIPADYFSSSPPPVSTVWSMLNFGSDDMGQIFTVFSRGVLLLVLASIAPFCGFLAAQIFAARDIQRFQLFMIWNATIWVLMAAGFFLAVS